MLPPYQIKVTMSLLIPCRTAYAQVFTCEAAEVVDACLVVHLERPAQALHPPLVPLLAVCLPPS